MEEKKYEIQFKYSKEKMMYELKTNKGESVKALVEKFIQEHDVNFPLITEEDYKTMWAHRTKINGLKNELADARKKTIAVMISPIKNACMELEKMLEETSDKLTEKLEAFKPKEIKPKTTSIITIEYPIGSEEIKKVKTYLNRVKIAYKEEEK